MGFDKAAPGIGWFATVQLLSSKGSQPGRIVAKVDALVTGETTLGQVLTLLTTWGFWSEDDFSEALALLPHMFPVEMDPGPRKVAEVFEALKEAAGE